MENNFHGQCNIYIINIAAPSQVGDVNEPNPQPLKRSGTHFKLTTFLSTIADIVGKLWPIVLFFIKGKTSG